MNTKRIDELDLLKTIAIVMVISQHIPLYNCDFFNGGYVVQYFFKLLSEGVPLFFAVNGFLLFKKDNIDIMAHYKKVIKMVLLVFFWEAVLIIVGMIFDGTKFNIGLVLDLFFRTGGNNAVYTSHLWYMQALIAIYCIYPFIWDAYHHNYELFKIFFITLCFFTIVNGSITLISNLFSYDGYAKMINYISSYIAKFELFDRYNWQLLYFCLGGMIYKKINTIKENKKIFVLFGIISWLASFVYGYYVSLKNAQIYNEYFNARSIFMTTIIIGLFALFDNYKSKGFVGKFITNIGMNTFGIYITHTYFLRIVELVIDDTIFVNRLLIVMFTLLISYLFTIIIKKIPFLKRIVMF